MTDDSTTPSPPLAAGWYPDTALQGTERYYDGTTFTEHTRPVVGDVVIRRRSRKGWIIGGSIAAGAVLVALIVGFAVSANSGSVQAAATPRNSTSDGDLVAIPDLVGMTVADARLELDAVGLTLSVPDGTDDQAIIATQAPTAGREVPPNTEVVVTAEKTPEPEGDSLSFADGAALDPLAFVGWQLSFGSDDGSWTPSPDAESGEVIFVNADDTCTAQYWQDTFDTAAVDDLSASEEFIAELTGISADEIATYAFDGHFALSNGPDGPPTEGEVATRTILLGEDGSLLLAARVFQNLDYTTSTMNNAYSLSIECDAGVDPMEFVDSLDEIAKVSVSE